MFSGINRTTLQRRRGLGAILPLLVAAVALAGMAAAGGEPGPATGPASAPATVGLGPTTRRVTPDGWFTVPEVKRPPLPKEVTKTFIIPIHGPIGSVTYEAVRRKINHCKGKGAQLVIFDMDTPGGGVGAMEAIIDLLVTELADVRRVAYVNPNAYSAGAIISLACHEIVMAERGVIGDAMPIILGPQGLMPLPAAERAKVESPLIALATDLAKENGYNEALCEGMVTVSIEVWLIRNRKTGQMRVVDANSANWRPNVLNAPRHKKDDIVPSPDAEWEFVKLADRSKNQLVTLKTRNALRFGFVEHQFTTMEDLKKHYNVTGEVEFLGDTASEKFVGVLNSQVVMTLLMMGMIFFGYTEMNTPGFGVAGSIALACLAVFVGARFLVGLANAIEIAALVIGLVLIALEIFVTPGFGVLGISGIVIVLASLAAMAVANPLPKLPVPQTDLDWSILEEGLAAMLIGAVLGTIGAIIAARYLPKVPAVRPMFLAPAAPTAEPALSQASPLRRIEPGDTGVVEAVCRPAGKVRFGDDLLDVTSEGTIISPGTTVRVLHRKGNMIVVEEA